MRWEVKVINYEIKICDTLKGTVVEGQYKGTQRGAKYEEVTNELICQGVKNNKEEVTTKGGASRWLEGRREPNFDTLTELCDIFDVYTLIPMHGGEWIRVHPEGRGRMELREAVARRDVIVDDLKARITELKAALANKQVPAETEEMGSEEVEEAAAEQVPNDEKEMGTKEWVDPNPGKYSVGMLCQVLAAMDGGYLDNNAGLQQKITVLDNDGNRKPISNDAFYRLIKQAKGRGLISVEQEIGHRKDENDSQIGKGKKDDRLITLLPNWIDKLGDG